MASGSSQADIRRYSGDPQAVLKVVFGLSLDGPQVVLRQSPDSIQEVLRQSSGVLGQSSGCPQSILRKSSGSPKAVEIEHHKVISVFRLFSLVKS